MGRGCRSGDVGPRDGHRLWPSLLLREPRGPTSAARVEEHADPEKNRRLLAVTLKFKLVESASHCLASLTSHVET